MRESCAATQVAVILAHSNVSHVRIAAIEDKLFIHHEPLEQRNTRALGERSGPIAKVERIQYSGRRLFLVVLWHLDTASAVIIMTHSN